MYNQDTLAKKWQPPADLVLKLCELCSKGLGRDSPGKLKVLATRKQLLVVRADDIEHQMTTYDLPADCKLKDAEVLASVTNAFLALDGDLRGVSFPRGR